MVYKSVSIQNVIAKILRDTRLSDSSFIPDLYEWIPEAMRLMQTNFELHPQAAKVKINFHQAPLPCGLIYLEAVVYKGNRLNHYSGINIKGSSYSPQVEQTVWVNAFKMNEDQVGPAVDSTLVAIPSTVDTSQGYQIKMDYISTTFKEGEVTLHYLAPPLDKNGLPLVPDQQDYKEAVYWYVRAKLIQAGYKDRTYGFDDRLPWERFEKHAARAISDITYPSVDQKEAQLQLHTRFIPPADYWSSMHANPGAEPFYGFGGPEY